MHFFFNVPSRNFVSKPHIRVPQKTYSGRNQNCPKISPSKNTIWLDYKGLLFHQTLLWALCANKDLKFQFVVIPSPVLEIFESQNKWLAKKPIGYLSSCFWLLQFGPQVCVSIVHERERNRSSELESCIINSSSTQQHDIYSWVSFHLYRIVSI